MAVHTCRMAGVLARDCAGEARCLVRAWQWAPANQSNPNDWGTMCGQWRRGVRGHGGRPSRAFLDMNQGRKAIESMRRAKLGGGGGGGGSVRGMLGALAAAGGVGSFAYVAYNSIFNGAQHACGLPCPRGSALMRAREQWRVGTVQSCTTAWWV